MAKARSGTGQLNKRRRPKPWRVRYFLWFGTLILAIITVFPIQGINKKTSEIFASKEQETDVASGKLRILNDFREKHMDQERGIGAEVDAAMEIESRRNEMFQALMLGNEHSTSHNNWESSRVLPQWAKNYFAWHQQQRKIVQQEMKPIITSLDPQNAATYLRDQPGRIKKLRFLVVRCFNFDKTCGGIADRLLPLPYLVRLAHDSSRLILIHFQRPGPLESYLIPPKGGIDWRISEWMLPAFNFTKESRRFKSAEILERHAQSQAETVVQSVFQSYHYGSIPYDKRRGPGEPAFRRVVRDIWRAFFTPVPKLQRLIRHELNILGLKEGHFASVHIRCLYAIADETQRNLNDLEVWAHNAVNCASHSYPFGPYFVASDSSYVSEKALRYGKVLSGQRGQTVQPVIVVTRRGVMAHKSPNHFDRPSIHNGIQQDPSDFDDTIVDLMLLAMGQCVTFGIGGYGMLASRLSFNESCSSRHAKKEMKVCSWNNASVLDDDGAKSERRLLTKRLLQATPSLLAPPM